MNQLYNFKKESDLVVSSPISIFRKLLDRLDEINNEEKNRKTSSIHVSQLVKSAASLYEKIRSTIDFKEEHLLRRGAIRRIIARRINFHQKSDVISEGLIRELIQAGYLKNNSINEKTIKTVGVSIDKYLILTKTFVHQEQKYFLDLTSSEIENQLVSHDKEEALLDAIENTIHQDIQKNTQWKIDSRQLSLSLRKVFFKSDLAALRFYLWKIHYPSWTKMDINFLNLITNKQKINEVKSKIEKELNNSQNKKLIKIVKPYNPIFIILQKIVIMNPKSAKEIFTHPNELDNKVEELIHEYHDNTKAKLRRSILRAVIFVLVTKMLLGILIEIPYDIYILGHLNWLPLIINLAFPPVLMFVSASLIRIPGEKNTRRLISDIHQTVYDKDKFEVKESKIKFSPSAPMTLALRIIYVLMFVIIFSLVIWMLASLEFNLVSGLLFFFFLSIVSFLAFRIRLSAKDLLVVQEQDGTASNIIDFLLLPFLTIGHWLALKFEGVNIFLFFLDFIIEAPFKTVLEVLGRWIDFIKDKNEELVS